MNAFSTCRLLVAVLLCSSLAHPALASVYSDDLTKCLVRSASTADKMTMVRWAFATLALHPEVRSIASVSDSQRVELNRSVATFFENLLTNSCRSTLQDAVKYEGTNAIQNSFRVLAEVSMREFMTNAEVAKGFGEFVAYINKEKMEKAVGRAAPAPPWSTYLDKGQYDLAIAEINHQLEMHPGHPMSYIPYNDRGEAYRLKGQFDQAIADYNKALEINPKFPKAYSNRGIAYRQKGGLDRAIADYSKALELDPEFALVYCNRAWAYYYQKEYDKAWDDVHKARGLCQETSSELLTGLRQATGREK